MRQNPQLLEGPIHSLSCDLCLGLCIFRDFCLLNSGEEIGVFDYDDRITVFLVGKVPMLVYREL